MKNIFILLILALFISCGGGGGSSVKYQDGDFVVIFKNFDKNAISSFRTELEQFAKSKNLTLLSKSLEQESCISLGFKYKGTYNENSIIEVAFTKESSRSNCIEQSPAQDITTGSSNVIFFLRDNNKKPTVCLNCNEEGSSVKYKEGDTVMILKNTTQENINFYKKSLEDFAKEKKVTLLSKPLESESCISLGFKYKDTSNEEYVIQANFTKGLAICLEQEYTDDIFIGSLGIIFFVRNSL